MELVKNLNWRYATKSFDPSKEITVSELEKLKEVVKLSASSYGLQAYKILFIENPIIREKLKNHSWGQQQVTDASHLMVFCRYDNLTDQHIDDFIFLKAMVQNVSMDQLKGYGDFIKSKLSNKSVQEIEHWMEKQIYIALGNLLMGCAELKIDACPIEGFQNEQYDDILGLKEKGLKSVVVTAIGYRSSTDENQHQVKVRKSKTSLFEHMDIEI